MNGGLERYLASSGTSSPAPHHQQQMLSNGGAPQQTGLKRPAEDLPQQQALTQTLIGLIADKGNCRNPNSSSDKRNHAV